MPKRTAEELAHGPPAPAARIEEILYGPPPPTARPSARSVDLAAFAEAAKPDTLMRAILPNDVIQLIDAKIRRPRMMAIAGDHAWLFDTGSTEQRWVKQLVDLPDAHFNSMVLAGAGLLALAENRGRAMIRERFSRLCAFRESMSQWESVRMYTDLDASALSLFEKQLFVRSRKSDGRFTHNDRFARVCDIYDVMYGAYFPAHIRRLSGNEVCSTRHGICVTGGQSDSAHIDADLYAPEADKWAPLPRMQAARSWHGSVSGPDGNTLFVFGGSQGGTLNKINLVERYDFRDSCWRSIAPHPKKIMKCHACTLDDGRIAVAGGCGIGFYNLDMYIYDPCADAWTTEPAWKLPLAAIWPCGFAVV